MLKTKGWYVSNKNIFSQLQPVETVADIQNSCILLRQLQSIIQADYYSYSCSHPTFHMLKHSWRNYWHYDHGLAFQPKGQGKHLIQVLKFYLTSSKEKYFCKAKRLINICCFSLLVCIIKIFHCRVIKVKGVGLDMTVSQYS